MAKTRKEQIYQVAGELFKQKGYHATSMRDLASQLGIQGGSLYAHISGKEELLVEVIGHSADLFDAALEPLRHLEAPPTERLRLALAAHIDVVAHNLNSATVFFHEWQHLSPESHRRLAERRDRVESFYRDLLAEGMATGVFRPDLDIKLAAFLILSAANWTYVWYRSDGPLGPQDIADRYTAMLLRGLLLKAP